jgi:hypothetical protein
MKSLAAMLLALCLLLSGCGWIEGSYQSVTPHQKYSGDGDSTVESATSYLQLRTALENMVLNGTESSVISVTKIPQDRLADFLDMAVRYVRDSFPMGAYAVEEISCELGTLGSSTALAVEIRYQHERQEILSVLQADNMEEVRKLIGNALTQYVPGLVILVGDYQFADIHQMVDDFAEENPGSVMEIPETSVQLYPNAGRQRILELKFTYQSSRDSLRTMGDTVQRVFNSAALYVSHDATDQQKLSQLYSFLMERFSDYQIKTSITPAYSLLNHGVGDSSAFAVVFAEMCQRAGVESHVVVGTRRGEPWSWNIVLEDGYYFHVDLLACRQWGGYSPLNDGQMGDYVWDYSAYPACPGRPPAPEQTQAPQPSEPAPSTGVTGATEPTE